MKKKIPVIILALVCVVLAIELYETKNEINTTPQEPNQPDAVVSIPEETNPVPELAPRPAAGMTNQAVTELAEPEEQKETSRQRIMADMSKTMEENPTINKMIEASQRGAIGALYSDMIEYLGLNAEETSYFMDVLMYRQMANVDVHMKMMAGGLTEEEKAALMEKVKLANETTRSEMEKFLNDDEDFKEFEYYEDTIGERMVLSQMDQKLGDEALSDESYREVLEIMREERENYDWSTDLHDQENRDLSPERFSTENIQKHIADIIALGKLMDARMQEILTPEQLEAWRESGAAMQALIEGQLQQANMIFGGE
ncbi:MAG TPA: hypothetical protein VLL07_02430 [Pontiella sp.]|nr:hypothetical protein [Pontiella sp.]